MNDLDAAIDRIHQLDDEHLEHLVHQLDEALSGCRTGPTDADTENAIAVAACARILLRKRRTAARCTHANDIVRDLISTMETTE